MAWYSDGGLVRSKNSNLIRGISRVIALSADRLQVALIRVDLKPAHYEGHYVRSVALLDAEDAAGQIESVLQFDTGLKVNLDELSTETRAKYDQRVSEFRPLVSSATLAEVLFDRKEFYGRLKQIKCVKDRQARRLLNSYFVHNKKERAFAQNYPASSGKGKRRHKFGKPASTKTEPSAVATAIPPAEGFTSGLYLSDIFDQLKSAVNKHGLDGALTVEASYKRMLMEEAEWFRYTDWVTVKGKRQFVVAEPKLVPSLEQYIRVRSIVIEELEEKERAHYRELRSRAISTRSGPRSGSNYTDVTSPGQRFELDTSKQQVRMCSSLGKGRIILPATIYKMVDVFSGLIVAGLLSPRPPSLALSLYFLRLAFQAKFELFKRLKLPYTEADFPAKHAPHVLSVDRAEFTGGKAEIVVAAGITIQVAPPMSPWDKGMIENRFGQLKQKQLALPGAYKKWRLRREDDGSADACITYPFGNRLLWQSIFELNKLPVNRDHVPQQIFRDGDGDISHIEVFRWGMANRYGYLRDLDDKQILEDFSFSDYATVSGGHLLFNGRTYEDPRIQHPSVPIVIDPKKGTVQTKVLHDDHYPELLWFKHRGEWATATLRNRDVLSAEATVWCVEALEDDDNRARKHTASQAAAVAAENAILNEPELDSARAEAKKARAQTKRQTGTKKQRVRDQTSDEVEVQRQRGIQDALESDPTAAEMLKPDAPEDDSPAPPDALPPTSAASSDPSASRKALDIFKRNFHGTAK